MFEEKPKKEKPKTSKESKMIKPLKDFCFSFNGKTYDLKKGKSIEVPEMFWANLKTEKVIK